MVLAGDVFGHLNYSFTWPMTDIIQLLQMKFRLLVLWILIAPLVHSNLIINVLDGLGLSNSLTLATNTRYSFNMTFSTSSISVPLNSYLEFQFGQRYSIDAATLSNCQYSLTSSGPYIGATCTTVYSAINKLYLVRFSSIFTSASTTIGMLNIIFNITNPYGGSEVTENILMYIFQSNGADSVANGLITYTYTASPINNCLYTSSNDTTTANSQRTIEFIPSVLAYANSEIVINFPPYFYQFTNVNSVSPFACYGITNSDNPNPACLSQFYPDNGITSAYEQITIQNVIATTKNITSAIQIRVQFLKNPFSLAPFGPITFQLKFNGIISQTCTQIYHTNTRMAIPSSINTGLTAVPTISSTLSSRTIRFVIREPFPASTGRLRVTFPNSLQVLYNGILSFTNTTANSTISLSFAAVSTFDITATTSLNLSGITYITPPSSRPFTLTINSEHVENGVTYGINSNSITYACRIGDITSAAISNFSTSINAVTKYDLSFRITNQLIANSFIAIIIPSPLSLTGSTTCSTNNSFGSCSMVNTSSLRVIFSGVIPANSTMVVSILNVLNGRESVTSSSFQIWSYYDAGLDSIVDRVTAGITVTLTPNPVTFASVSPTSTVTYQTTSYTFTSTLVDPIPPNGYISIIVPPEITIGTLVLSDASFSRTTCSVVVSTNTIRINDCFSATMSNLTLSLVISGLINPKSLQPTSSFALYTFGPNGQVNFKTTDLSVTMITAANSNSFAITLTNNTVSEFTSYTLKFNFTVPHIANQYILFTIPSSMAYSSSPSCSSVGISSVTCSVMNATVIKMVFLSSVSQVSQIVITNIRNFDIGTTVGFSMSVWNSNNFLMETSSAASATYLHSSMLIVINNNDQIALYENSNLTLTVTTPNTLQNSFLTTLTQLYIVLPSSFTVNTNSTCSSSVPSCSIVNKTITINNAGLKLTSFVVSISNLVIPFFTNSSQTFAIEYRFNDSKVAVSNNSVFVRPFCTTPCQRCSSLAITCKSCLPTPNTDIFLFPSNNTCLNLCPNTFYPETGNICTSCVPPCSSCSDSVTCTSCVNLNYFHLSRCITICPATFYANDTTRACQSCKSPCGNCTSETLCLSCTTNYFINSSCVNGSSCPLATFPDDTNRNCSSCPITCSSCTSFSVCTSCKTGSFLYNSSCISSCPNTTFAFNGSCSLCSSPCLNCQNSSTNCSSCIFPKVLQNNSCLDNCLEGSYSNGTNCLTCSVICRTCNNGSTCSACLNNLFLINGSCSSTCPAGTFRDVVSFLCSTCTPTCSTCQGSASNCSNCLAPLSLYEGNCTSSCPPNYFSVAGSCLTCTRCRVCTAGLICIQCQSGNFMLNSICYSTCPSISIPDLTTLTCTLCDPSCATCAFTTSNCLSCSAGLFLVDRICQSSCPSGYIADASSRTCSISKLGSIVYFPFSITFLIVVIIVFYSKQTQIKTDSVTSLCGLLGVILWLSWLVFIAQAHTSDLALQEGAKTLLIGCGIMGLMISMVLGGIFIIWFRNSFKKDLGLSQWMNHSEVHLNLYRVIFALSFISFSNFRIIYSRLFNKSSFSCFIYKAGSLLSANITLTIIHIIFSILPLVFLSAYIIFIKKSYDQTLISAIDSLLLDIIMIILLIIDAATKDEKYFLDFLQDQHYLKRINYDQINNSTSSIGDLDENKNNKMNSNRRDLLRQKERRPQSALDYNRIDKFFREKVTIIQNLNKFQSLDKTAQQQLLKQKKVKTLPNDIENYPQFDLHQDEIQVVDDEFFNQENERRRQLQEEEQRRRRNLQAEENRRKQQEEALQRQRRRKQQEEQDLDEQHQIEFPDLAALEKLQRKGKESPTHLLSKFKKVQDKIISEKDKKKLQDIAKKNGLDKQFFAETFGVQKHFNPNLLNQIIDIHHHVKRDSVKQLFSPQSNPEVLQELFSKTSHISPEKLRNLLNSKESAIIIQSLADKQKGIVSPEIAKLLLDEYSKYSEQFVKTLLNPQENGMDSEKLQSLLRDNPNKAQSQMILKNLKKIGGNNLENKVLLQNLLGKDSLLDKDLFLKVTNDLPKKLIDELFGQKNERNDILIEKLLNNKKIDLKNLAPLLDDPQMLDLLAEALKNGNEHLQENIINLFKNGEPLDKDLLREMLKNKTIMEKMMSKPIDPAFLTNLLKKDANTNLQLLQQALVHMTQDQIAQVFQYKPQKNIDFQKVAKLFEYNQKTDPKLIAELLTPEIMSSVYSKTNNLKGEMLSKLVQRGKKIDKNEIIKIYGTEMKGKGQQNINLDEIMEKKYNITDSHFNANKLNSQETNQLGFQKSELKNSMSRTDGGMLGFLNPVNVALNKKHKKNSHFNQIDQITDENTSEFASEDLQNKEEDDEFEYQGEGRNKRRRKKRKLVQDIRLPSEHIYLQRLQAPHELKKKQNIRKKKKVSSSMAKLQKMDEENEVYDLDF